jgi:5-carboxymethyl-2-hydroxymuconic-semialdehyde dehydrogenase
MDKAAPKDDRAYSFDFYMETKHVSLAKGSHRIRRLGILSS